MKPSVMRSIRVLGGVGLVSGLLGCGLVGGEAATQFGLFNKEVRIVDDQAFTPAVTRIITSVRVRWIWSGDVQHNVTWDSLSGGVEGNSVTSKVGDYVRLFDVVGEYKYHCSIHPSMTGMVRVDVPFDPNAPI